MTEIVTRFVLTRKSDGFFRKKARPCHNAWTPSLLEAQIFKTKTACKLAAQGYLWEQQIPKDGKWVPPIKHPEWFDEKFEVLEVSISLSV